ncbi:hypothetical protein V8J83_15830 [Gymnodinialimonas sp. 2307UL20-7]
MHPSIAALKAIGRPLTDDDYDLIVTAQPFVEDLPAEPNAAEIAALITLFPANGDTANGLNWPILHCIEASADWPIWELIGEPYHEWHMILRKRLENAGHKPPKPSLLNRFFGR